MPQTCEDVIVEDHIHYGVWGTFLVSKRSEWHERLSVATTDNNLIGHAGAVLLRRCADRTGLTGALNKALPRGKGPGWWDRGTVLVALGYLDRVSPVPAATI